MKKKTAILLCIAMTAVLAAGCGKKEEPVTASSPEPVVTETETPTPEPTQEVIEASSAEMEEMVAEPITSLPDGQMYSYMTGEVVSEETGNLKPFAIMINNLSPAVPQSGLTSAEIIYEIRVESGITRFMAFIQDPGTLEKIGPVRSLRHYYMDFANDHDANIVCFGGSYIADNRVADEGLKTIDGMNSGGFYRSSDRVAPHNAYTSADGLRSQAQAKGMETTHAENYESSLLFNESDTVPAEGEDALNVKIPFSTCNPYFEYNAEDGLYYRFEYGAKHVDQETGDQLKFKNIIVQYVKEWTLDDESHHEDMDLYTEGKGLYITDGKAQPITWKKTGKTDKTRYYNEAGEQIRLNPGKTMFEVVPNTDSVSYSA